MQKPVHLDVRRTHGLIVHWADGHRSFYPVAHLRRHSPSAETRTLREQMARNPLTVLPAAPATGPLTVEDVDLVGNYAIRIRFSDGHQTGIYSWTYLREIDPHQSPPDIDDQDTAPGPPASSPRS